MFRCADFSALHDKRRGLPLHLQSDRRGTWHTIAGVTARPLAHVLLVARPDKDADEATIRAALKRAMEAILGPATSTMRFSPVMRWVGASWWPTARHRARVHRRRAAHLMSPTGGFGMNTGIQDAVDLGWKLEACRGGAGRRELLRSYEVERRRSPSAMSARPAAILAACSRPAAESRRPKFLPPGPAGDAARADYGEWFTQTCGMNGSPSDFISGTATSLADHLADGTPAPPLETSTTPRRAAGAARPHPSCPTGDPRSICSAAALCCCASALTRRAAERHPHSSGCG